MKFSSIKHIHFIGIGGIGMSGIATILKHQGYTISGCDIDIHQKSVLDLTAIGCTVYHGNNTAACYDHTIDLIVYSSAIDNTNPEILAAQQRGIPTIQRAVMLADLMRTKFSIAVAGAHGKTTTTSMIAHILREAALDPTIIVGGYLENISKQAHLGTSELLVAEADESDRSFLKLFPVMAVITNIDLEHVDVYRDLEDIIATFAQFLRQLPFYGTAFVCTDNEAVRTLLPLHYIKTIRYGTTEDADIRASEIRLYPEYAECVIEDCVAQSVLGLIRIPMPGIHNVLNATAAVAVARALEVPFSVIVQALSSFAGIERRFSFKGIYNGVEIFDDYGHHPTEIEYTLRVATQRAKGRVIVAFQPHRYSRTEQLMQQFVTVLKQHPIDQLIITDIYPAGEVHRPGLTAALVDACMQYQGVYDVPICYMPSETTWDSLRAYLASITEPNDLILFLGAGKLNKAAELLVKQ